MSPEGIGLLCDIEGLIAEVLCDALIGAHLFAPGAFFSAAVHESSRQKAAELVRSIVTKRAVFDMALAVPVGGRLIGMRFCGASAGDHMMLIGVPIEDDDRFEALMQIHNEQASMLRAALKAASTAGRPASGGEADLWEQLTQVTIKLAAAQRELAKKNEEVQKLKAEVATLTVTDPLTSLLSRRGFLQGAEREVLRSRRYGRDVSVLLLDVDRLEAVNQAHGPGAGDQVLCVVAARCEHAVRTVDLVGRYGGDEIALLLPETDGASAWIVAERLRKIISSTPVDLEGAAVHVTASVGVATLESANVGPAALLARAESALAEAKESGRDRSCAWSAAATVTR